MSVLSDLKGLLARARADVRPALKVVETQAQDVRAIAQEEAGNAEVRVKKILADAAAAAKPLVEQDAQAALRALIVAVEQGLVTP